MLHVVCSGLNMYISYVCVCVGGGWGLVCWGWCLHQSALNFTSAGEVKVDHIRRSWCDQVKVFDIVSHVYSTVLGNYSTVY